MSGTPVEPQELTVGQLNQYLKNRFDADPNLGSLAIRGEISNYKKYPSGHHYFSLKDASGVLNCVMFRTSAQHLRFQPQNGMQVVAFGRVTVFPRDGRYQLYADFMTADGVGDLHVAFEQLRQKLEAEGLFDRAHKKPIPTCPDRVALITSGAGAAVRDMIRILGARWPMTKVVVLPVRVQGAQAPAELIGALRYANRWQVADVILIGRGGGSIEDLWAFNDEGLARAIYDSDLPVISAVGHEPDVTISDYVADLRAATPSNAAELAVPDQNEVYAHLNQLKLRLARVMQERLKREKRELNRLCESRTLRDPMILVQEKRMALDLQQDKLKSGLERRAARERQRYAALCASLDSLSPLKVLSRGYALTQDPNGRVITSARQAQVGEHIQLTLGDGTLGCTVTERMLRDGCEETEL
jgi:exodeoxyribonuclease VII large subunit